MNALFRTIKEACKRLFQAHNAKKFYLYLALTLYISSVVLYILSSGGNLSYSDKLGFTLWRGLTYVWLSTFTLLIVCQRYVPLLFKLLYALLQLLTGFFIPYVVLYDYNLVHAFQNFLFTNQGEAREFLKDIPWYCYGTTLLFFILSAYTLWLSGRYKAAARPRFKTFYLPLLLFSLILGTEGIVRNWIKGEGEEVANSKNAYIRMVGVACNLRTYYLSFQAADRAKAQWHITQYNAPYDDYILVIGESASADYMHLYGYPETNTPFLDSIKGLRCCQHYYASATHTLGAFENTFTMTHHAKPNPANTVSTLANAAGFQTFWLSNQAPSGHHDTTASCIAKACSKHCFLADISKKEFTHDSELLPLVKEILQTPTTQKRLIVLHLMGSHPKFEKRLEKPLHITRGNEEFSAYLQTLEQTDDLLRALYHLQLQTGRKFTLLYTSDHGLARKDETLRHGFSQSSIHVPFVMLASDLHERQFVHTPKYAVHFMAGFANWLGLQTKELQPDYNFWQAHPLDRTKKNVMKNANEDLTDGVEFPTDQLLGL